ncbi:porin family protein [Xanthomarina sp. F1114]|uniref:porin family protein n=1 Tax=Xanthomarina sp. F1114 TaxID=2996019 RepID=UPI00225E6E80|nr:porin family protein [Xanthomarina sp. F1114]MCX7548909.1 porin family protein [Xanthomarina sp. F1114]
MKNLLMAIVFIAISLPTFSQVKINPGLRMGLNASNITNQYNSDRVIGFNGAMFVNFHFARFYELQPEMTYSNQGFKGDSYTYLDPYSGDIIRVNQDNASLHYLGLSVANKFYFFPDLGLHFIIGPSLEFNISDNSYYDITPIDISLFGGIGYEFPIGLGIEARYKQGVIDVRDSFYNFNDGNYYENNKLNSVFQFNVYYKFDM